VATMIKNGSMQVSNNDISSTLVAVAEPSIQGDIEISFIRAHRSLKRVFRTASTRSYRLTVPYVERFFVLAFTTKDVSTLIIESPKALFSKQQPSTRPVLFSGADDDSIGNIDKIVSDTDGSHALTDGSHEQSKRFTGV
jgi:hypothetical protein